jgi:hypothetical protein
MHQIEVGHQYNRLTVIAIDKFRLSGQQKIRFAVCRCTCGKTKEINASQVLTGRTISCGCAIGDERRLRQGSLTWEDSKASHIFHQYKRNATKRTIPFTLTRDEFKQIITTNCYYCGNPPSQEQRQFHNDTHSTTFYYNGIDRIDNTQGYVKGNVLSCCKYCNSFKSQLAKQDTLARAAAIIHVRDHGLPLDAVQLKKTTRELNSLKSLFKRYKKDARERSYHVAFNLSFKQFCSLVLRPCGYCGTPPKQAHPSYTNTVLLYTGLDRTNNTLGYSITNVIPACKYCNGLKLNDTLEAFYTRAEKIAKLHNLC